MNSTFTRVLATLIACLTLPLVAGAKIVTETIEYQDGDVKLKGFLAYDDASKELRPGVLVCPEWWGLNDYAKRRATMIAELGYVAFAVDYYGDGKIAATREEAAELAGKLYAVDPKTGKREIMRSRLKAALNTLKAQKQVDAGRLASIGYCLGGASSIELARSGAEGSSLRAVVSFHGALTQTDMDDAKNIKASLLVCHGAVDPFVPPEEVAKFQKEMDGAKVDYQLVSYANAVHSFTNPEVDARKIDGAKYNEKADQRSWEAMKAFLAERFKETGKVW